MKVLEVKGLKKKLGNREIIKGIDLEIGEREIFGFLGPNGAGKTTTIRMLVGLINPTEGEIRICGNSIKESTEKALENVGAVVENPELYKYLSGRENLMQIARIREVSKEEVDELIKLVGLEHRIDDKVKKYSLGMKQRLGLAAALIGNPKLLILDEPTNGLDPSGILDFREIVKKAVRERGISVFISSHILNEIQQLCDRVAFVNHGVIQSVESIHSGNIHTEKISYKVIFNGNKEEVKNSISNIKEVISIKDSEDGLDLVITAADSSVLIKRLIENRIEVLEVYKNRAGLEQRYMELVEGGIR